MDFDVNVSRVQGTLYSLGSQGLLNKSDSIPNVVEAIKEIICGLPDSTKSKITFFMVLNTQLAVSEELKNDDFVCLFTNVVPYIEKEYLVTYVYHLNLQQQLFKVIENCPGALSLELLDVIIKKLKEPNFHRDEFSIEHFYQLWESVFVKICKISERLHLYDSCDPFVTYFQEVYELIQKVLITLMKVGGLEGFLGFHLYNFFKSILNFLQYRNFDLADNPVYQLSAEFKNEKTDITVDYIKVCNSLIFENIFKVLENLTVDMWMSFSEFYFDFDAKNSAQLLIGGLVCSIIDEIKHLTLPSDVLNCLSSLAIKKSDFIAKASIDEIIGNVKDGEINWFPALISHQDFANENSLECLVDNLHMANSDDLKALLKRCYEYLCSCEKGKCSDLGKKLFLKAIKTTDDPSYWVEKVFEKYQPDLLTTPGTHDEIIETFNKISKEKNVPNSDILSLCLQSPFSTISRICHMAVCGSHQTDFIIEILKLLKHACDVSLDDGLPLLDHVLLKCLLKDVTDVERQPFCKFVVQLRKENLLKDSFFSNLLKTLKGYLEKEVFERAVLCLEVIRPLLNLKLFHIAEAPFLVFMSQVLRFFSWDLNCFSVEKVEGRDLAGCIVALVISRLDETKVRGPEFQWARREISSSWEVIQAHFCDLWFSSGLIWSGSGKIESCILALIHSRHKADDLRKFLITFDDPFQIIASIVTALSKLLPISTFREWNSIFDHLIIVSENLGSRKNDVDVYCDVLDIFGSALFILALISKLDGKAFLCYQNCLRNFGRLTGICCPKMTGGSFLRAFEKIFFLVKIIEDENERKCCWEVCSPALMELIDWMIKKKVFEAEKNTMKRMLPFLDLKEVADVINKNL